MQETRQIPYLFPPTASGHARPRTSSNAQTGFTVYLWHQHPEITLGETPAVHTEEKEEDYAAYICQTPSRTFFLNFFTTSVDKLQVTSKSQRTEAVIASISYHPSVEASDIHRKSILNIVYSATFSPHREFRCVETYRAACQGTDG